MGNYANGGEAMSEIIDWSAYSFFVFYLTVYFFDFTYFGYFYFLSAFEGDLSLLFAFDFYDLPSSTFFLLFGLF